ncbi:MAG: hypothetical protein WCQ32_01930 [bacterium]
MFQNKKLLLLEKNKEEQLNFIMALNLFLAEEEIDLEIIENVYTAKKRYKKNHYDIVIINFNQVLEISGTHFTRTEDPDPEDVAHILIYGDEEALRNASNRKFIKLFEKKEEQSISENEDLFKKISCILKKCKKATHPV